MINTEARQKIIAKLGIGNLSQEEQDSIIDRLEEEISSKVNVAVIERLNESERQELLDLANAGDELILGNFISSHIENLPQLITDISKQVVKEFVENKKG